MATPQDLEINRGVRRILVKHWIDLGRISVRTMRGRILVYGTLQRIEGRSDPLMPPTVDGLFRELRTIKGVHSVAGHLENWTNDGGRWRPTDGSGGQNATKESGHLGRSPQTEGPRPNPAQDAKRRER